MIQCRTWLINNPGWLRVPPCRVLTKLTHQLSLRSGLHLITVGGGGARSSPVLFLLRSKDKMAQTPLVPTSVRTGDPIIDAEISRVGNIERAPAVREALSFEQPYQEVENLVWARNNPVYRIALDEWERKERLFSARVERREKRSADLINQIFNIVGFFSGFQGLVLTAVTQLSASNCKPQCRKVWFPIVLTVVAAFVTVVGVWQKFQDLKDLEDSIKTEKQAQTEVIRRGERVRTAGPDFKFYDLKELDTVKLTSFLNNKGMIGVYVAVIAFTVIFIFAYLTILCDL